MARTFDITTLFPPDFYHFVAVVLFSFLLGLEQRIKTSNAVNPIAFGTDRTFTFIGILGFVLYKININDLVPFLVGLVLLGLLLISFYVRKMIEDKRYGITTLVLALITYCLAPLVYTQPYWLAILIVMLLLMLEEMKVSLLNFSKRIDSREFITLAKFLVMAGVVLPLLPKESISPVVDFSLYKLWMAIVAISGISYLSYLLKEYVFPRSGIVVTGILGGMYSSTATTFILAKKSKEYKKPRSLAAAILLATSMMFVRIFILAFLFNKSIAMHIIAAFGVLFFASVLVAGYLLWQDRMQVAGDDMQLPENNESLNNPLELRTALVFGVLFVCFSLLTHFVTTEFRANGIKVLSFLVGVTDIDPFIVNIFQSKFPVSERVLVVAVINAVTSNNLLKMIYAVVLSDKTIHRNIIIGFSILIVLGVFLSFII